LYDERILCVKVPFLLSHFFQAPNRNSKQNYFLNTATAKFVGGSYFVRPNILEKQLNGQIGTA